MDDQKFCQNLKTKRTIKLKLSHFSGILILLLVGFYLLGQEEEAEIVRIAGGIFLGVALGNAIFYLKFFKRSVIFWKMLPKYIDWKLVEEVAKGVDNKDKY